MSDQDWESGRAQVGVFLNGQAIAGTDRQGHAIVDDSFMMLFNGYHEAADWTLPKLALSV